MEFYRALRFWFFVSLFLTLIFMAANPLKAQDSYFSKSMSAMFFYNQYAPGGTLPVGLTGSVDTQISGSFYNISAVDITAQPTTSPDGKFKMPLLTFTGRTGLKYYLPSGNSPFHFYMLGDLGLSGSAQSILGNYAGGGGADLQIKPSLAIPIEFRAIGRSGAQTNYIISFGLKHLFQKK